MIPPLPEAQPATFRTTVHGTLFGERAAHLDAVAEGDPLLLIPDPPMEDEPEVWVHRATGDPLGHLPPEISQWLAVWLLRGGKATATAVRVRGHDVPSWKRLLIEVHCATNDTDPDADTDNGTGTDNGTYADTDTETDIVNGMDADTDAGVDSDANTDADNGTDAETDTHNGTDADTDAGVDTDVDDGTGG
jgi:hypothetical protein